MTQVELQHDIIAYMTEFLDISDLIAFEQTSMDIHTVICQYNIWKARFRRIWSDFNFALDPNIPMRLDASLLSHYKTESQAYASLIPSIQLLPQELDFEMTEFDIRSTSPARSTDDDINLFESYPDPSNPRPNRTRIGYTEPLVDGCSVRTCRGSNMQQDNVVVYQLAYEKVYHVACTRAMYFEVTIESHTSMRKRRSASDTGVSVGFGLNYFSLTGKPGRDSKSVGYYGNNGKKYLSSAAGEQYAEPFGSGDTIGCGFCFNRVEDESSSGGSVFYTKNGRQLGQAYTFRVVNRTSDQILSYPVVYFEAMYIVNANFGQRPFKYNGYIENHEMPPALPHWTCPREKIMLQRLKHDQALYRGSRMIP